ncbi:hypothetical protein C0J52_26858 [Blattella germanica]|nr:hypothetical protein C0J52_26858 [Blattella germanica]PSN37072.1 hypothetical protein C0J52_26858 [Blattella germanica]
MVLTNGEKIFILEYYLLSYGVGRQNGPSLRHVREQFGGQFNKIAPKIMLAIVEKFRHTESVLGQRKGRSRRPRTVNTNKCSRIAREDTGIFCHCNNLCSSRC